MNTRTKLNISMFTACGMACLIIFSKPLHISELFHWVLLIGIFIPLGLVFYFKKIIKQEKEGGTDAQDTPTCTSTDNHKGQRRRILLLMGVGSAIGLSSPLWLPLTGATLGIVGDLVVGIITAAIVCTICGILLRKLNTK